MHRQMYYVHFYYQMQEETSVGCLNLKMAPMTTHTAPNISIRIQKALVEKGINPHVCKKY